MTENNAPQHSGNELPQPLVDAIRKRHGPEIAVPGSIDEAVLADASAYLQTMSRPRRVVSRGWTWAFGSLSVGSLAAAMLLVAVLREPVAPEARQIAESARAERSVASADAAASAAFSRDDIDQNGRVDILDAFALARTIERGETPPGWDQNSDGQVNQDDVDLVARNAVML